MVSFIHVSSFTTRDWMGWAVLLAGTGVVWFSVRWRMKASFAKAEAEMKSSFAKGEAEAEATLKAQREQEAAERREFYAIAKRLPATVVSSVHVGEYNLRPLLGLRLRIEAPEGAYEVDVEHAPQPQYVHHYGDGEKIDVYVDPKNRDRVKCAAPDDNS